MLVYAAQNIVPLKLAVEVWCKTDCDVILPYPELLMCWAALLQFESQLDVHVVSQCRFAFCWQIRVKFC